MKQENKEKKKPVVCIVMGMAGSGKTTLLQRLNIYTAEKGIKSYFINLDPAVKKVGRSVGLFVGLLVAWLVRVPTPHPRLCDI